MGMIGRILDALFGSGNVIKETAEVFRVNAEADAVRAVSVQGQALNQFGMEFAFSRQSLFDRLMDAINRIPRPALALGTIGLFVAAMFDPVWFAERMTGIALVPEPLWWLLGVIVSFYFGARHQAKGQAFQKELAQTLSRVPQVVNSLDMLREFDADTPSVAETGTDANLTMGTITPAGNAALEDWARHRAS
ncbi:holin family protein [Pseudaestuariivita atlantica]|uniref:Carboxylesterase n=1 Tax=Pseudaestuariivita atlantica TaxID=1317121 RepID=A0A0L1JNN2_9RHOB|nr:holin family protein [Pseudaestuariivita atlantica]KNG92988.1 carboxylesterase [Pseudaestuariivita atlantica]